MALTNRLSDMNTLCYPVIHIGRGSSDSKDGGKSEQGIESKFFFFLHSGKKY